MGEYERLDIHYYLELGRKMHEELEIRIHGTKDGHISYPPCTIEELLASCGMKEEF